METDPIFEAIAAHKAAYRNFDRLWVKLDEAEGAAVEAHRASVEVNQVAQLFHWHYEIDQRYEWFLDGSLWQGFDPQQVEAEYRDAKRRYREAVQAGKDWDKRTGVAPLRLEVARARRAEHIAARRLAKTKPTNARGAGALVDHVVCDLFDDLDHEWHKTAPRTAARSLINAPAVA